MIILEGEGFLNFHPYCNLLLCVCLVLLKGLSVSLTDDMEIAPDFFDYFEAAASLMDRDEYVTY